MAEAALKLTAAALPPQSGLAARATALARWFDGRPTEELLEAAIGDLFADRIALVSSFGAESAVLLHLVAAVDPETPVIFINSGRLFAATHKYREMLVDRLGLSDVRIAGSDSAVVRREDPELDLWARDNDRCCAIRKVAPLGAALAGFDAWMSGRKRYHGGGRGSLPLVEADGRLIKVNPLAAWTAEDVRAYAEKHGLPEHPMVKHGFRSIGCVPCTDRVRTGEDARAGRWRGTAKTECGIHLGIAAAEADGSGI